MLALVGKWMEIMKEMLPGLKRIAATGNVQHPGETKERDAAQAVASALGLAMCYCPVKSGAELEAVVADIARKHDEVIVAFADGFKLGFDERFAELSLQHLIPVVDGWAQFAERGNLMTYGPVFADVYRRIATHDDRIRKGAKPGELPVELPSKVELVVNARTTMAIGITIPPASSARADVVIR